MKEGDVMYLVLSDAGYGLSTRAILKTETESQTKMARLAKKGHKNVQCFSVTLGAQTTFQGE